MIPFIHIDLVHSLIAFGYLGIFLAVFSESGFFIFFLPGDSLLFAAGLIAVTGTFNIFVLSLLVVLAAILGDSAGYGVGRNLGRKLFERQNFFLQKKYLERTERFFAKHGSGAIVLARFVPIVRTFTPMVAGVALMPYKKFLSYNIFGGLLWGAGLTLAGYFLGAAFPALSNYLWLISAVIIAASLLPIAFSLIRR